MSETPTDTLRATIAATFAAVWSEEKDGEPVPALEDGTVLLETGLDSLSFAVFVTELEDTLGYDPFALSDEAYYPTTFGDFVAFYQKFASAREA